MKKTVLIVLLVGMFGWAIYEFVGTSDKPNVSDVDEETEMNEGEEDSEEPKESTDPVVGLESGNIAPDFELMTLAGETVKLSDYRGKRVMLNFWATWCPPCRAEMPDMQKFHENKDVVILAVNLTETDEEKGKIPDFIEKFGITFPILLDEGIEVANMYQIQPIPTSYLIDSKGIIHNKALGALNYDLMVQEFEKMD